MGTYIPVMSMPDDTKVTSCSPVKDDRVLSPRLANYKMDVELDHERHLVQVGETISWHNHSPDTIGSLRLYMYINAFSGPNSSYLRGRLRNVMGQDLETRPPEDWGHISVRFAKDKYFDVKQGSIGNELGRDLSYRYIQPDDGNEQDSTVLEISLIDPVLPDSTIEIFIAFEAKLPRTIARTGYGEHGFHHFVHWYPKLGVYEQDEDGIWGWNCHQFLPQMEFYGDHGNYEVNIRAHKSLTIGGSGCLNYNKEPWDDGSSDLVTTSFVAHDVIDFGWVASPHLTVTEDQWEHVDIRLLGPSSHASLRRRILRAAKHSLSYFAEHVGEYPYNTLTILDPPLHGLRSGFMEYPTYITGGAFYSFPKGIRSMESLIIHEFAHQYFMQIMANNEKEAPWLDEGFVTFYEDCVMEDLYGEYSLIDIFGYKVSNSSFTRNEFVSLPNRRTSPITEIGYKVRGEYKGIIYSKTATVLKTLKAYLGEEAFDDMMKSYFERHKFTHPRKDDFITVVNEAFEQHPNLLSPVINEFLAQALDGTQECDYAMLRCGGHPTESVPEGGDPGQTYYYSYIEVERKKDFIAPVEIGIDWSDGSYSVDTWDGVDARYTLTYTEVGRRIESACIDPEKKLYLDIDFNNNSYTDRPERSGILKYATRSIYWVQNIMQSASFLM